MSLFGQIKSILNKNGTQPSLGKEQVRRAVRPQGVSCRFSHTGRRILVVDDSATVVASLGKVLRSAGCVVREAGGRRDGPGDCSAGTAGSHLSRHRAARNGTASPPLRQIRRDPRLRRIPVIIISGNEQATEKLYAQRIGADDLHEETVLPPLSVRPRRNAGHRGEVAQARRGDGTDTAAVRNRHFSASHVATASSGQSPLDVPSPEEKTTTENLSNAVIAGMTALEARRQLTSMDCSTSARSSFQPPSHAETGWPSTCSSSAEASRSTGKRRYAFRPANFRRPPPS